MPILLQFVRLGRNISDSAARPRGPMRRTPTLRQLLVAAALVAVVTTGSVAAVAGSRASICDAVGASGCPGTSQMLCARRCGLNISDAVASGADQAHDRCCGRAWPPAVRASVMLWALSGVPGRITDAAVRAARRCGLSISDAVGASGVPGRMTDAAVRAARRCGLSIGDAVGASRLGDPDLAARGSAMRLSISDAVGACPGAHRCSRARVIVRAVRRTRL